MEFVNSIAKIVHMETSLHGGFPNKNVGDAFLLVTFTHPSLRILSKFRTRDTSVQARLFPCRLFHCFSLPRHAKIEARASACLCRRGSFPRASTCATSSP